MYNYCMSRETKNTEQDIEKRYADFISTVSHELRTPLTSIMGFADTLLTSSEQLSKEQQKKFLQIIKDQSKRLINMVENLLVVSKLQNSNEKLVFKSINPNDLIIKIIQLVKIQFSSHNFITVLTSNIPEILVDTDKFQQIILNLLENAVKYSDEGSNITIKTCFDEKNVYIKIMDEGIGISDENKHRIFDKFTRLDTPLTRKTQGSGLGLYIVKQIVENMDGKVSITDNQPKGSCFTLEFNQSQFQSQTEKKLRG